MLRGTLSMNNKVSKCRLNRWLIAKDIILLYMSTAILIVGSFSIFGAASLTPSSGATTITTTATTTNDNSANPQTFPSHQNPRNYNQQHHQQYPQHSNSHQATPRYSVIGENFPRNSQNQQPVAIVSNLLPLESKIGYVHHQESPLATSNRQTMPAVFRQELIPVMKATGSQQQLSMLPRSPNSSPAPQSTISANYNNQGVTSNQLATSSTTKRNDVFSTVYRSARDTLGGLANLTPSLQKLGYVLPAAAMVFVGMFAASPFLMPELKRSLVNNSDERFGIQGRLESFVSWVERSVEDLPAFPKLHPQECIKRAICEVNQDSKKYGVPGLILQVMFPANNRSSDKSSSEEDHPSRVVNKYILAANYGKSSTDPEGCKNHYEECIVNLLDIFQNLMGLFLK